LEPARAAWRALWTQPRLAAVFDQATIARVEGALQSLAVEPVASASPDLPLTLCHGDAHHENLLTRDDGAWVWADWQEVGIGCGVDDVSFFYQRSMAAGGNPD